MKQIKIVFSVLLFSCLTIGSAQEIFQLDSVQWNFHKPQEFEISESSEHFLSMVKPDEKHVNALNLNYISNHNLSKLTLEIYVFSLVETYKKGYNTDEFSADVQMERKKINDHVFYLIRSFILHKESNYQYVSDVYLTEINGKEFSVILTYDNDEDKMLLEESFFNSYFS